MKDTAGFLWSLTQVPAALAALASASGLPVRSLRSCHAGRSGGAQTWSASEPSVRLGMAAAAAGLDVEETRPRHGDVARALRAAAPALIPVGSEPADSALAVVAVGRWRARLVRPDGAVDTASTAEVVKLLTAAAEEAEAPAAAAIVGAGGEDGPSGQRAVAALVRNRLRDRSLGPWWLVRGWPGASFWQQCRRAGLGWRLGTFVTAHAAQYVLFILSWAVLGEAALDGSVDGGALLAWALLLAAMVPARLIATALQASVAIGGGRLLRRRLLHGALRLEPEEIRREGAGQLLGRVLEAEAVEDLAIGGGLLGLVATVELVMAVAVLASGSSLLLALALAAWTSLTVAAALRYVRRRRGWARSRLGLTHDLVEKMGGHRTRLVQQPPERWHEGEAERLAEYGRLGRAMDRGLTALLALAPRGWVVVALAVLSTEVARGATVGATAVGAGGILLALLALTRLVAGLAQLADAAVAWDQVKPLFDAAARPAMTAAEGSSASAGASDLLIHAEDLVYRYAGRDRPALERCSVKIEQGDRILLEGPSGSGKSTLASLLSGLRQPTDGRLLLGGADMSATGVTAWRRRVVASPQFHENHMLLGSLAFNLLLGRRWPPQPGDLEDAYRLCVALGLGPVIDRMPSGLLQIVGETGWQLSHGERSLVFLARALLQRPDLVLLDESLGSLDPTTFLRALAVIRDRANALVLISQ